MQTSTRDILNAAERGGYAVGGFNVYNLEGVKAVIDAAEHLDSCVILQVHPAALEPIGPPLIDFCLSYASHTAVPVAVHLDHATSSTMLESTIQAGVQSVMADGSQLAFDENLAFVRSIVQSARNTAVAVEAELGRISGTEDDLTVAEFEARLTDPDDAARFVHESGIDMLAVCIGNVHGPYPAPPQLDFERLARIRASVEVPLVLHGASGLDQGLIQRAIALGVRKFNVNTEVRNAYLHALRISLDESQVDLTCIMAKAIAAMQQVVEQHMITYGSVGSSALFDAMTSKGNS